MGFFSNIWKGVKNVFNKVTKAVKNVVKSVGKTAKKVWDKVKDVGVKVWDGVKSVTKKVSKTMSKFGPFANIAMNFIPGFGQLWAAYGVWGQVAKGAIAGYLTSGGDIKGALLGAAGGGLGHAWNNMSGNTISEKVGGWFDNWKDSAALSKAGGFHMKGGELIAGKAPLGTQMMGRSSDAYGFAETNMHRSIKDLYDTTIATGLKTGYEPNLNNPNLMEELEKSGIDVETLKKRYDDIFKQVDIDAMNYNEGYTGRERAIKNASTAKAPPSLLDKLRDAIPNTWGDTASAQQEHPDSVGGGGSLTSYNTAAGVGIGRGGYGRDPNEELVRSLGLTSLLDQYNQYKQRTGYA